MVKADLTRDYYGDLELAPTADVAEIKKQFKKLALKYHPDRNPGQENEVTAKFQRIQSAHEVLIDSTERAKYDANRVRASGTFRNTYAGASGMRGNPWSNVSSQYPTPPKPPTSARKSQPPPPSSGAERYRKNFQPPPASAYQAAQEGPQARKATYEGWENLRHSKATDGAGKTWKSSPQPPPRGTPASGREESNARPQRPVPPRPESSSQHQRSSSSSAANRKGFMPNTPGGDEPPAPRGSYFTQRDKPNVAPDLPARDPQPSMQNAGPDPLRQFRQKAMPTMEPRLSTPYATHGGEKLNPFESANLNRSKSTRERTDTSDSTTNGFSPTTADPNNKPPRRASSFADRSTAERSTPSRPTYTASVDSSSDEEVRPPRSSGPRYRPSNSQQPGGGPSQPDPKTSDPSSSSKPSKISQFRQWMRENPNTEPPPNGFPPDGPPLRSGQAKTDANSNPSMYENSSFFSRGTWSIPPKKQSSFENSLPTVAENTPSRASFPARTSSMKLPSFFTQSRPTTPPSGVTLDPKDLNAFETLQRSVVDGLLSSKRTSSSSQTPQSYHPTGLSASRHSNESAKSRSQYIYTESAEAETPTKINSRFASNQNNVAEAGSPSKKFKHFRDRLSEFDMPSERRELLISDLNYRRENNANHHRTSARFNFDFPNDAFSATQPPKNTFSSSAENISTKFTPEDWEGKFEAGGDYFKPDPKAGAAPSPVRGRAQSGSRSRGRSPTKVRPGEIPSFAPPTEPTPTESPGTKFSAEEWNQTFRPQTFAPPPPRNVPPPLRKRTPTLRTTLGGKAAVVDDGSSSNEDKPLFTGRKPTESPTTITPDPMDVDTPPANHTVPLYTAAKISEKLSEPQKRPAESAPSTPTDTAELQVGLDDLKIKDLITSLNMPQPPLAPAPPAASDLSTTPQVAYENYLQRYAKYSSEWDTYNTKFLLHMLARKNHLTDIGSKRWTDERATEQYRLGLKEDQLVLKRWVETMAVHESAVREFCIVRERMKGKVRNEGGASVSGKRASPRKKTH
ncbi:hypothetical protein V8E51_010589 [Hyaloscypha variabilis]